MLCYVKEARLSYIVLLQLQDSLEKINHRDRESLLGFGEKELTTNGHEKTSWKDENVLRLHRSGVT